MMRDFKAPVMCTIDNPVLRNHISALKLSSSKPPKSSSLARRTKLANRQLKSSKLVVKSIEYVSLKAWSLVLAITFTIVGILVTFMVATSPIDPMPLVLPEFQRGPPNRKLECIERLGEGGLMGPEDIALAHDGSLLVTTRDGWVKKLWLGDNGHVEDWQYVGGYPCGLALGIHGEVLVCDPVQGLLNVTEDGMHVVTDTVDGLKFNFADSVVVLRSGQIYFTDATNAHTLHHWHFDVLEARPRGRVLHYDPTTGHTRVLMEGLAFANGIALSPTEDYLVVCESWKYRCLRYWLEGASQGLTETFTDNLPGLPDNIHLHVPSETFWIGIVGGRSCISDLAHKTPILKHIFARVWSHFQLLLNMKRAELIAVNEKGEILASFQDPTGSGVSFTTGAIVKGNYLYISSLTQNYISRIPLNLQECSLPKYSHWPLY